MSRGPITVSREPVQQPAPASTSKDQKAYRVGAEVDPQALNAELDRLHARINRIVVEAEALADLDTATATAAICAARLNAFGEILRDSGLLRRDE